MTREEQIERNLRGIAELASGKEGGELALALVEVIRVIIGWREDEHLIIMTPQMASDQILTAIERGLGNLR